MNKRTASVGRETKETSIDLTLNLDGRGEIDIDTSVPFLDHMLSHVAVHGFIDMSIKAKGDTEVDLHHTVEDVGICLGSALKKALGDRRGIVRYGTSTVPMEESLATVSLDLCGRPHVEYRVDLSRGKVGEFDTELGREFMRAFANSSGTTVHVILAHGVNTHHSLEAIFKALGRALRQAVAREVIDGAVSTKGTLSEPE
ncbi:imidazoleglycerol-phosphate dehydratase HisB [Candidatus Hydrogenedentota bacterium]